MRKNESFSLLGTEVSLPLQCPWTIDTKLWERQESVDNDSDPERDNHIKMVQTRTWVRASATKKRQSLSYWGLRAEGHWGSHFATLIISLERFAAQILHSGHQKKLSDMIKLENFYLLLFFQAGSQETVTRKLQNFFFLKKIRLYIPLEEVEGTWSTGSVLLDPSGWRLETGQKEENGPVEWMFAWIVSLSGFQVH